MYQYKVILDVYGGEVTVGSIPTPTYDYWTQRGLETLQSHLTLDDIPDVPICTTKKLEKTYQNKPRKVGKEVPRRTKKKLEKTYQE